jgi:hypothetical protein
MIVIYTNQNVGVINKIPTLKPCQTNQYNRGQNRA